jgi:transcriptional regulator with XRE-family HTH domain
MRPPDHALAEAIGTRIRTLRLAVGITAQELGRRTGSHRSIICRIELGYHVPNVQTLAGIASAFGMSLSSLLAGVDDPPSDPVAARLKETA